MISHAAMKSGFSGGVIVDYPNSSLAKKYYLLLNTLHVGKMEFKVITGHDDRAVEEGSDEDEAEKEVKKSLDLM